VSEPLFRFEQRGLVGVAHVTVSEVVHPDELDRLRREFREYVASTGLRAYVLDLTALQLLTSAALGLLLNLHAQLKAEGRRFAVVARNEMVVETLEHTHLEKVFLIATSMDQAVEALRD
jgi:anti-anti-sigma factor